MSTTIKPRVVGLPSRRTLPQITSTMPTTVNQVGNSVDTNQNFCLPYSQKAKLCLGSNVNVTPRFVLEKMTSHVVMPQFGNLGILKDNNGKKFLYIYDGHNKWQKCDLNEAQYSALSEHVTQSGLCAHNDNKSTNANNSILHALSSIQDVTYSRNVPQQMLGATVIMPISFLVTGDDEEVKKQSGELFRATLQELITRVGKSGTICIMLDDTLQAHNIVPLSNVAHLESSFLNYLADGKKLNQLVQNRLTDLHKTNHPVENTHNSVNISLHEVVRILNAFLLLQQSLVTEKQNNKLVAPSFDWYKEIAKTRRIIWQQANMPTIAHYQQLGYKIEVIHWEQALQRADYNACLQQVKDHYNKENDASYKNAIDETVRSYLKRTGITSNNANYTKYNTKALDYVIEECAVFACLMQTGFQERMIDFHVYPSGETSAIAATRAIFCLDRNKDAFRPVQIRFSGNKKESSNVV